jgi:hypothetical protein
VRPLRILSKLLRAEAVVQQPDPSPPPRVGSRLPYSQSGKSRHVWCVRPDLRRTYRHPFVLTNNKPTSQIATLVR